MKDRADIFTIDEISKYLKTPKSTIYMLTSKGQIPCFKVGKQLRFRKKAIDQWAEGMEKKNAAIKGAR
ncbi:helix-turn-helix domain-containing protein [Candidatus Omnitrophota bacterium]